MCIRDRGGTQFADQGTVLFDKSHQPQETVFWALQPNLAAPDNLRHAADIPQLVAELDEVMEPLRPTLVRPSQPVIPAQPPADVPMSDAQLAQLIADLEDAAAS